MRYYLTPIRMNITTLKKKKITRGRKDAEKLEP